MLSQLIIGALSAALSLLITPLVRALAIHFGAVDKPREGDIPRIRKPRLGGLALTLTFLFTGIFAAMTNLLPAHLVFEFIWHGRWVVAASLIILGVGIADDVYGLPATTKLVFQTFAAAIVLLEGHAISIIINPFTGSRTDLAWLSAPITLIWIVGITNAVNLIDGIDGLAAGVALIASASIWAMSTAAGIDGFSFVAAALSGALAGFLWFNFHPAKTLLGDSGSLLLGFLLSLFSLQVSRGLDRGVPILTPILMLWLPITDTLLAILRRLTSNKQEATQNRNSRWFSAATRIRAVFRADQDHIHHRLLTKVNPRQAVYILYALTAATNIMALATIDTRPIGNLAVMGGIGLSTYLGLRKLGYWPFKLPDR